MRTHKIEVVVDSNEKAMIVAASKLAGRSVSAFLRVTALDAALTIGRLALVPPERGDAKP